jgi:catechol 2,3-dioxygenase-like lactoylglutathione lyase family enzyme
MDLGNFAVSLAVKDLEASKAFYEKFGEQQADETTTGPASFVAVDPDGNPMLVDQHV